MTMTARLFGAACLALAAAGAQAHVQLENAEPRVGSQVRSAPAEVKLWFSEALEGAFSKASVTDPNGRAIDKSDAHLDAADDTLLHVSLPPLGPGAYTVHWRAVSIDSHVMEGKFVFHVGP